MSRYAACLLLLLPANACALSAESEAKNQPVAPFRIAGNVYYVGASDVTSYLVATSRGLILIDGGFAETVPQIEANIVTLGFRLADVKVILNGHAHPDHAGGLARLKQDSGAKFEAMAQEVVPLENEGRGTFYRGDRKLFESIKVDRTLHDGDTVQLGETTLMAHLTAGHTPGCTTWTTRVRDGRRELDVVFTCQVTLPADTPLVNDSVYPTIAEDFARTFATLASLPCDVFLAEHGSAYSLQGKIARMKADPRTNVFIDPQGYRDFVRASRAEFETALAEQREGKKEAGNQGNQVH
jgi:metallo-beta-lactamase class B